ncbi:hypothetical protein LIA77_11944 [Sarocladium implicatum]|nr:hypothetical protein LIA77_11944 [Sarocladium implicatum]
MDTREAAPQASGDPGSSSSGSSTGLVWPLTITICGTIIVSWALGTCLVWWTRRNTQQPPGPSRTATPYHELDDGSDAQSALLPWLLSTAKNKTVLRKDHSPPPQPLQDAMSIQVMPSPSFYEEPRSIMPTPVLPVLPQNSTFNLGKAATPEDWSVMAKMRRNKLRRGLSVRSVEDWNSHNGTPQELPDRFGMSRNSHFQSRPVYSTETPGHHGQGWSGSLLLPQNGMEASPYSEGPGMSSVARTPNFALGDIPDSARTNEQRRVGGTVKGLGISLKNIFSYRNLGGSATGLQTLDSRSPTTDSLLSLRGLRLADLISRSPRDSDVIPRPPSSLNLTERYLYPSGGSHYSSESLGSTRTTVLREPRPAFYRDPSSPALSAHCYGTPQHPRQPPMAGNLSNTTSCGSNVAGGYGSSGMQALLAEKIQNLLETPSSPIGVAQTREVREDTQEIKAPQPERPRGPRPMSTIRVANH